MNGADAMLVVQWMFVGFFVAINVGYIALNLVAAVALKRYRDANVLEALPDLYSGLEPPVSLLVPAYNEESTIDASVRSMLQLRYPQFELIVINDGSRDGTMDTLKRAFDLELFPRAYWPLIEAKPIRGIYRSRRYPDLRVVDKENGGKADALNAGINVSRYPLFCGVDADSILEANSLRRVAEPFLNQPDTIVSGGTIRIANGCEVEGGFLTKVGLPRNVFALFQVVEYIRAFLFGRLGWSPLNAVLIISGAFGLFRKDAVIAANGYRHKTIGEDMELIVRMHRHYRLHRKPYQITYVPDPVCYTEAPETFKVLKNQRVRWQRGLCESLTANLSLLFHPRGGAPGWLAFPFMLLFELAGPLLEVLGYAFVIFAYLLGGISFQAFVIFMALAISLGMLLSVSALLLEEISFHVYDKPGQLALLIVAVIAENLGYRQLNSMWRLWGLWKWATGTQGNWGTMTRKAAWSKPT
ncbi:MAG: glycosyltransferase family 2 protein [Betaproteobacteria bacterium]|nr:glycosyltransferase family 2 protein [Betaproteobacteria bacterium]